MSVVQNNYCTTPYGIYAYCVPTGFEAVHSQVSLVDLALNKLFCQVKLVAYNATNFRVLWEIKSDGVEMDNFTSKSEEAGYPIRFIKSDIIEQQYRSQNADEQWVQWDCGFGRTMSLDTFALLGTNLTPDVSLVLRGYGDSDDDAPLDDAAWAAVDVYATITKPDNFDEVNVLWCAPTVPADQFRHWRLEIDDPTNPDEALRIGRLLAGSAMVFDGENCLDELRTWKVNYKNETNLNGYTRISNERAYKKNLSVSFRNLQIKEQTNYRLLDKYINYCRDTLKALVIVDPSDQYMMYKYSAYAKLDQIPVENHKYIDNENVYATLSLDYVEGK